MESSSSVPEAQVLEGASSILGTQGAVGFERLAAPSLLAPAAYFAQLRLEGVEEFVPLSEDHVQALSARLEALPTTEQGSKQESAESLHTQKQNRVVQRDELGSKEVSHNRSVAMSASSAAVAAPANKSAAKQPGANPVQGRGIGHIRPGRMIAGAWVYLSAIVFVLVTITFVPTWMILHAEEPFNFWLALPVLGMIISLLWAARLLPKARCSVCMQPFYLNLRCLKNRRAHRFALGSTPLSTALMVISRLRARCPYCGTNQHMRGSRHSRRMR